MIDEEIRKLVEGGEAEARQVLEDNIDELHIVGKALLEYETLSGEEVRHLLAGGKVERPDPEDDGIGEHARSSVPSSGAVGKKDRPASGFEPEPQPQG